MRRIATALLIAATSFPAAAQVDCGSPLTGSDAAYAADYARNVTVPLIDHNAGGLGPVLWAYIAGQARAESLANMRDADGGFVSKPNNNLWNVQTDATKECSHRTIVGCLPANVNSPYATNKDTAQERQCWLEGGNAMQWVKVCFPSYPTLESAAELASRNRLSLAGSAAAGIAALMAKPAEPVGTTAATADIATYARLAGAKPLTAERPKPLYLRAPDAKPQAGFILPRRA